MLESLKINATTPRTLEEFTSLFDAAVEQLPERARSAQLQHMYIADLIFFALKGDGFASGLPFTRGEAYQAVGIPKEFLAM